MTPEPTATPEPTMTATPVPLPVLTAEPTAAPTAEPVPAAEQSASTGMGALLGVLGGAVVLGIAVLALEKRAGKRRRKHGRRK